MDQDKLDKSLFKFTKTSRGLTYRYYCSPAKGSKPTLVFLHGFPKFAFDWHYQVDYFSNEGFGIIVPDMLGYGETDKPEDFKLYRPKLICQDIVDILDHEGVGKCVGIGHDWYV